jgi:hypothetical protein
MDLLIFLGLVAVLAVIGVRLGMMLAPAIGRLASRDDDDEEPS